MQLFYIITLENGSAKITRSNVMEVDGAVIDHNAMYMRALRETCQLRGWTEERSAVLFWYLAPAQVLSGGGN